MFCPECGAAFGEGFTRCESCGVDLVEPLPEEGEDDADQTTIFARDSCLYHDSPVFKEYTDLVTVFAGDEGVADLVRAKLESCGIHACVQREPYLRLVVPVLGQIVVQVRAGDAEAARRVLEEG